MNTFIDHIVEHLENASLEELHRYVFVFPSRRACYYFRDALLKKYHDRTFWMPSILSIEDFIMHCTRKSVGSEIDLLFALYQCYSTTYHTPPSGETDKDDLPTFDKFYAWGQVLLKDFDEVDRYMVDAEKLYRNLDQLTKLESRFQGGDEMREALERFNDMMGEGESSLKTSFSNQWSRVSKTYHLFRGYLKEQNLFYSGLLYRELAEKLTDGALDLPFERVYLAGFNALSKAEETIMEALIASGNGYVFWDADRLYLDNEVEEAGRFMRRYYRRWRPSEQVHWVITDMVSDSKEFRMLGGVQAVGQAQALGQLLGELPDEIQQNSGIVLADESLILPVLHALPETTKTLNVTMGYPTKHSHWFHLANTYLEYQMHIRGKTESAYAEVAYTRAFMDNPLVKRVFTGFSRVLTPTKSKWLPARVLLDSAPDELRGFLKPQIRVVDLIGSLVGLTMMIYQRLRVSEKLLDFESELAFHSLKHLMQLEEQVKKHSQQLEPKTLARLVIQAFEQAKVPFSGEPTYGLQLMGFLETRVLDFENLVILSANEGKLPRGNRHQSYIPFAIRKAFKMPTFIEHDAIYAYHFKRILQRARNITIFYNTEVAIDGSGEKSRYIWQLKELFPSAAVSEATYQMGLTKTSQNTNLTIEKHQEIVDQMQRFILTDGQAKSLSPTAVRHYLDCSLRFYFRYIVRLKEREEETHEIDARDFGNIVHDSLESIYRTFEGELLDKENLAQLKNSSAIKQAVDASLSKYFRDAGPVLSGKDLLQQQVIEKLLVKVIENDFRLAPLQLVGSEMTLKVPLELDADKSVLLQGTLDRVHHDGKLVNIIDYKTGRVDLQHVWNNMFPDKGEQYIREHFDNPRYKAGFQGFFYGYLWSKAKTASPLKLGIYPLKKVNLGIKWLNKEHPIPVGGFTIFETLLKETLLELFNPEVPFEQTQDSERCKFCDYKEICQR